MCLRKPPRAGEEMMRSAKTLETLARAPETGQPHRRHVPDGHLITNPGGAAGGHNLSTIDCAPHLITFIISKLKR